MNCIIRGVTKSQTGLSDFHTQQKKGFRGTSGKEPDTGDRVPSLGHEHPLEEGIATHSSILTWRIPWTEGHGGLQSMGSQRVGHD